MIDRPAAVLWDLDGTIVDTEPDWMDAETALIARYGGTWTREQGTKLVGFGLRDAAAVIQQAGVPLGIDEIIATLSADVEAASAKRVTWRPGARELLKEVRDAGIPTALVTMSYRSTAEAIVAQIGFPAFDVIVTGDDGVAHKPDPAPYLAAADALGIDIRDAVAIEDSATGTMSAVRSGATVITVPHHGAPGRDAAATWPTLAGRTLADLSGLIAGVHR